MLIASTRVRPFAVTVTAQIYGNRMLKRKSPIDDCSDEGFPAAPLIPDTVDENEGLLFRIAPLPVMKPQTVVNEVMFSRFQIHQAVFAIFQSIARNHFGCESLSFPNAF